MDFFDNVVNKSNAILKERLNNPFGQKQPQQSQDQSQDQQDATSDAADSSNSVPKSHTQGQASTSSKDDKTSKENSLDQSMDGQDKSSQFAGIAADAEAVAQKAAKGAQKFGTFLFSMANKAGQTVTQTAKQVKQVVENTSMMTDFTREQQEFRNEHGPNMEVGKLPWSIEGGEEQKISYMKEQILSLSQDKRNFVRSPPQNAEFKFDPQKCYPVALALLKEDPNLNKMRYELVPKLVNEDTFWCNYFYRVEMLKQESTGKRAGWASSRSSSGEGPDEVPAGACRPGAASISSHDDGSVSPNYAEASISTQRQENFSLTKQASGGDAATTALSSGDLNYEKPNVDEILAATNSDQGARVGDDDDDLKKRLRELNIGSFDGGQDDAKSDKQEEVDDEDWDEELQREFELVSGDLSGLDDDELKNELLEIEEAHKKTASPNKSKNDKVGPTISIENTNRSG